ncbi:MAG TPA: hypothetical protein PLL94_05390 [Bacteroidales bacterium]|jgi:hypothetical protein|nr:MAG: hypothetical protein BWX96_01059 [Bacteroidetes bacterium ADurb.Bin145]HOU02908.1 hypothetical protein [Bacteroidales bacterium]HQK67561.1 hypothetical protein [Bacteroidales bacterium]
MKSEFVSIKKIADSLLVIMLVTCLSTFSLSAQQKVKGEPGKTYQITMNDGSVVSGKLISDNDKEIVIQSGSMGDVRLEKSNIRSMTAVAATDQKAGGIWFANPNSSKYLLGSSAIPLAKGSGYYQNTWIFVNSACYAFTNNISVAGGFEIISIMAKGEGPYAFFINPKASFKVANNLYAGANVLYANTIKSVDDFGGLATLNGFFTYGNTNNNLTAAVGWGWADGEFSSKPVFTVSGMTRVSRRIAFVSENWIIPRTIDEELKLYGIFSYGIRFLGEKTSIDLAFLNNKDIAKGIIIGIPWLDFTIAF